MDFREELINILTEELGLRITLYEIESIVDRVLDLIARRLE